VGRGVLKAVNTTAPMGMQHHDPTSRYCSSSGLQTPQQAPTTAPLQPCASDGSSASFHQPLLDREQRAAEEQGLQAEIKGLQTSICCPCWMRPAAGSRSRGQGADAAQGPGECRAA
jgi:hypothetical protein